jgi:hypothetical protein
MVRASDSSFTLRLADGRTIPGRLVGRAISGLARLLGRLLLVFGNAQFGPSGELEWVDADGYVPNDGQAWDVFPGDPPESEDVEKELARRRAAVMAALRSAETEEQLEQALREIR